MASFDPDQLEARLAQLMRAATQDIAPRGEPWPGVQRRLTRRLPARHWSFASALPPVAAVLALALVVGSFAWIFAFGPSLIMPISLPAHDTHANVTITVTAAEASSVRTLVAMSDSFDLNSDPRVTYTPYLVDARGQIYPAQGWTSQDRHFLVRFPPLPQELLGARQTLRLHIDRMTLTFPDRTLIGPWVIAFTVQPTRGQNVRIDAPAATYGGVTIQPLTMDWAPVDSGISLDGKREVGRLTLRIAGLPSSLYKDRLSGAFPGAQMIEDEYGKLVASSAAGPQLVLRFADGQTLHSVSVLETSLPRDSDHLNVRSQVGPSGVAEVAVTFLSDKEPPTGGVATVAIDGIQLVLEPPSPDEHPQTTTIPGAWTFPIPFAG